METDDVKENRDVPLPATLKFVLVMGTAFLIGWLLMFALLKGRW
jgi:hypothetical protein